MTVQCYLAMGPWLGEAQPEAHVPELGPERRQSIITVVEYGGLGETHSVQWVGPSNL